MKQIVAVVLAAYMLTACGGNKADANAPTPPMVMGDSATTKSKDSAQSSQHSNMATTVLPATATPPQQTAAAPVATAAGMNPPHGQPGHRCDISVGAPLNSAPTAQPAPAAPTVQPTVTQQAAPTAPTASTAPGMNPPHGQPGHRCDISVGAPLNSAPVKKN